MVIDFLIAIGLSIITGLIATGMYQLKFKRGVFSKIRLNIGLIVFIIVFGMFLFTMTGFNIWSVIIIPLASLVCLYIVVRNAIGKLLETSNTPE